jgi:hypothetical protein
MLTLGPNRPSLFSPRPDPLLTLDSSVVLAVVVAVAIVVGRRRNEVGVVQIIESGSGDFLLLSIVCLPQEY